MDDVTRESTTAVPATVASCSVIHAAFQQRLLTDSGKISYCGPLLVKKMVEVFKVVTFPVHADGRRETALAPASATARLGSPDTRASDVRPRRSRFAETGPTAWTVRATHEKRHHRGYRSGDPSRCAGGAVDPAANERNGA
jgi:hypothetical protein